MQLPETVHLTNTVHGHGANGLYFYVYTDVAGSGLQVTVRRESRSLAETKTWQHPALPDQNFLSFEDIGGALAAITDEQAAAEAAKWPKVEVSQQSAGLNNRCRLCPRDPFVRGGHWVRVMESWCDRSGHLASLCDAHRPLADDAAALIAALDAEVAARKARAARNKSPLAGLFPT